MITSDILNEMTQAALWGRVSQYATKYPKEWVSILADVKKAVEAGHIVYPE